MADGDIKLSSNFELNSQRALDARTNVASIDERNAIPLIQRYDRMIVSVRAGLTYQLKSGLIDNDLSNNLNWDLFNIYDHVHWKIESLPGHVIIEGSKDIVATVGSGNSWEILQNQYITQQFRNEPVNGVYLEAFNSIAVWLTGFSEVLISIYRGGLTGTLITEQSFVLVGNGAFYYINYPILADPLEIFTIKVTRTGASSYARVIKAVAGCYIYNAFLLNVELDAPAYIYIQSINVDIVVTEKTSVECKSNCVYVNGILNVGTIIQNGLTYETHAEQVYSQKDLIILRELAISALAAGTYSGFKILKYDGSNNLIFAVDFSGIARIGDEGGTLQALATREDNPTNGYFAKWNATTLRFECVDISTYHDARYSQLGHTHDYAATNHLHDARYSQLGHTHDYAATNHNHDASYSQLGHTHDYAVTNHTHSYLPLAGGTLSGLLNANGHIRMSVLMPYIEFRDSTWNSSSYIQQAVSYDGNSSGNFLLFYNPPSKGFSFQQGAHNAFIINTDGNIGIGTTSPTRTLQVGGTTSTGSQYIRIDAPAANENGIVISSANVEKWYIYRPGATNDLRFYNGGDKVTFLENGNVGIGTTSPQTKLHVYASGGGMELNPGPTTNLEFIDRNNIGASVNVAMFARNGYFAFNTGAYIEVMRINSAGNVGIGTTSPSVQLDVNGELYARNDISILNNSSPTLRFKNAAGVSKAGLQYDTIYSCIRLQNNNDAGLSIYDSDGRGAFSGTCYANDFILNSDKRLKKQIKKLKKGTKGLKPKSYKFKNDKRNSVFYGFLAQDVEKTHPELIELDENGYMAVKYNSIIALLVNEVNQLKQEIKVLKSKIA